jgi:hypothetical protein
MPVRRGALRGAFALFALHALTVPSPAAGQFPELPTLQGAGLEYISRSGFFQLLLSGRLDIEGVHRRNEWGADTGGLNECDACHVDGGREMQQGNRTNELHRLRVFADIFLGDHLYSLVEVRADRGRETWNAPTRARLDQFFVRAVTGSATEGIQVGRFASPFGSYAERHLSDADPFLTPPLAYSYRTVMNRWRTPGNAEAFAEWKDRPEDVDLPGTPTVWDVAYQWGAMAFGRLGPVELRGAAMNSAPSSAPRAWNLNVSGFERPSWVFGARWRASPSVQLGASYNRGPWLSPQPDGVNVAPPGAPVVPPPENWRDFDQELISADIAFMRGPVVARAEVIRDRWQVPNVPGMPTEFGYSAEVQTDVAAGFFVAARAGLVDFRPLESGQAWEHDVRRFEGAVGYRLSRNLGVLASGYRQVQDRAQDGDTDFIGVRLWWAF